MAATKTAYLKAVGDLEAATHADAEAGRLVL